MAENIIPRRPEKVDIAIITILEDEFTSVRRYFQTKRQRIPDGRTYLIGKIKTHHEQTYTIAIARCSDQGTDASQRLANYIIHDLDPQLILVVGIAGGIPHEKFTLGDVVVSTHIINPNVDAWHADGTTDYTTRGGPPHPLVEDIISILPGEPLLASWAASIQLERPRQIPKQMDTGGDNEWSERICKSLDWHFGEGGNQSRSPKYTMGPIISSNHLMKDPFRLRDFLKTNRSVLAVEMEAAGVYEAAQGIHHQYPVMAIRGISDIVGLKRDERWTAYACQAAAAFTYAFIMTEPITPENAVEFRKEGLHMWTETALRRYHNLREKFVNLFQVFDQWLASEPQKRGQRLRVLWLEGEEGEHRHQALLTCLSGVSSGRPPMYDAGTDLSLLTKALDTLLFSKSYSMPPLISIELSADEPGIAWKEMKNALIKAEGHIVEAHQEYPRLIVAGTGEQAQEAWRILQERLEIKLIDTNGLDLERPYSFHGVHGMVSETVSREDIFNRGLPITTKKLFGREEERETLTQAWHSERCRILSLVAYGGTGKSALVNEWLSKMRAQDYLGAQKVFAWSFYSQGTKENLVSADLFVNQALIWLAPNVPIPLNPWAQGQALARLIKKHRFLLVLDGLEPLQHPLSAPDVGGQLTDDSIRALLEELSKPNDWKGLCVITTRVPLTDLHRFEDGDQKAMGRVVQLELENLDYQAGAALLKYLIRTDARQRDLEKAVGEVQGHALAITLLGNYLRDVHQGDLEGRFDLEKLTINEREGGHARRIMASYERWLQENQRVAEMALLHVIGLFDRPAPPEAMSALLADVELNPFTTELDRVGGEVWNQCVDALREMGLLNKENPDWPGTLDAHPLVREHFRDELQNGDVHRWAEGNRRLFTHYSNTALPLPADSKGMNSLYAAVTHGCAAGLHQQVFDDVLLRRVWRDRRTNFSTRHLGMTGSDLVALSNYFQHRQWTRLQKRPLSEPARILILTNAGVRLRQLGRLVEARQCFGAVVSEIESIPAEAQESEDAAYAAAQYCELLVIAGKLVGTNGDPDTALVNGQKAIAFADRGNEPYFRMHARSSLGEVYFMLGEMEKANSLFEEARAIDQEHHPDPPFLYSQSLFRYGYSLIETGRAQELLADAQKSEAWGTNRNDSSLLSKAIRSLILGAAHRAVIESGERTPTFIDETEKILDDAIIEFRTAGYSDYIVRGLLERAHFYRMRHLADDYGKTLEDLDQATFEAQRGQMGLLYADILLQRLACYLDFWPTMSNADRTGIRDKVAETLTEAIELIEKLHYYRRQEMLAALQIAAMQQCITNKP